MISIFDQIDEARAADPALAHMLALRESLRLHRVQIETLQTLDSSERLEPARCTIIDACAELSNIIEPPQPQDPETRTREQHEAMWARLPSTHIGVMCRSVELVGTDLTLQMGDVVTLTPARNNPEGGVYAKPFNSKWRKWPNIRLTDDSIHLHYGDVVPITHAQMIAHALVFSRYEREDLKGVSGLVGEQSVLMLAFHNVTLGIEKDGYTHS